MNLSRNHINREGVVVHEGRMIDNSICETCIPDKSVEKVNKLTEIIKCPDDYLCTDKSITLNVEEEIEISSRFTDPVKSNYVVYPHSIYVEYYDE